MKKIEIVGYKRANLGPTQAQAIRNEGNIPCVLYGGSEQIHFYAPAILFRPLLFTPDVYEVTLNIEGDEYQAVLQETQFHPVADNLLHADFLQIVENKPIKVSVPVRLVGNAPGVQKGGKLVTRVRKLRVRGLAQDIPDYIDVNVSDLDLGKSVRVGQIQAGNFVILESASNPVASIEIPRALRGQMAGK
ncbi:50S ribosomal protein L25/general stress protein Ctc [Rudanella paleaurantiibacter]|uniref:Large ribosomal subunit protein bL25 n=1 Tax=Rudanella paleaurantiibacter TaxID=2614655 RepID=A0A7J5TYB3_9BACT|nr:MULTISPECIES: 50S ribosomal protein L25/general stress protein Ctc [Rudanella]KAB7728718.1 50S ribosomal protein L25/general stress protein Ctc [Rudanella paleaurantiibacter]